MLIFKSTVLDLIHRCDNLSSFKQLHAQLLITGAIRDDLAIGKITEFFGRFVHLADYACNFLNRIERHLSPFNFNKLIACYASSDAPQASVLVYRQMVRNEFLPCIYNFPVVMKSCTKFMGIQEGKQIHAIIFKMGFSYDLYVQNSLLHFYGVCGECQKACSLFDELLVRDVVSWTSLISGHVSSGFFLKSLSIFSKMDLKPNEATFVSVVVASGRSGCLNIGKGIHNLILKHGLDMNLTINNALMDMYVKCECLFEAKRVFDEVPKKDIISWTIMLSSLVQLKRPKDSLELFHDMQLKGVQPDRVILTSVLSACANLGALDFGKWVHEYIDSKGIKWDIHIGTALVDMYAKCGCIEMALKTFDNFPNRNVRTWNVLIGGLAMHGHGYDALRHFDHMIKDGVRPTEVTFLAVLTACCHSGLVNEGRKIFYLMSEVCGISPKIEHYGCMLDLLCRARLLNEAKDIITTMPVPADVHIWGAFLSACNDNGVKHSQELLDELVELESKDSGAYVLLSNIFAADERWGDVTRVRRFMKEKGIRKTPGSSVIEVDGKAHEFLAGDLAHPQFEDIRMLLELCNKDYREGRFHIHSS